MLRGILIASAAAAMLLVTFTPNDAYARGGARAGGFQGGAVRAGGYRGGAVAVRGYLAGPSLFAADATAIGARTHIAATATAPERRPWELRRSAQPQRERPTMAAAVVTIPTATGSALAVTATDRLDTSG